MSLFSFLLRRGSQDFTLNFHLFLNIKITFWLRFHTLWTHPFPKTIPSYQMRSPFSRENEKSQRHKCKIKQPCIESSSEVNSYLFPFLLRNREKKLLSWSSSYYRLITSVYASTISIKQSGKQRVSPKLFSIASHAKHILMSNLS